MKTAISLPDSVFDAAELIAQRLGVSRSELYVKALNDYIKKYNKDQMLAQLNEVYAEEESTLAADLVEMQLAALPHEEW